MKNLFVVITILCLLVACSKDKLQPVIPQNDLSLESRGTSKVDMCHKNGKGEFNAISISSSAIAGHLAHGDYLADADGDGYSAIGACTGTMDDCDDNDPNVGPCCIIDEGTISSLSPYLAYFDSETNFCLPFGGVLLFGEQGIIAALSGEGVYLIAIQSNNVACLQEVTESDFLAAVALLRNYIITHPEIPPLCPSSEGTQFNSGTAQQKAASTDKLINDFSTKVQSYINKAKH